MTYTIKKLSDLLQLVGGEEAIFFSKKDLWENAQPKVDIEFNQFRFMIDNHVTGSSIFTSKQLEVMISEIQKANPQMKTLYFCDLMQEYHGFFNYKEQYVPFICYSKNNQVNKNLDHELLLLRELEILTKLGRANTTLDIIHDYQKTHSILHDIKNPLQIVNPQILSEEEVIELLNQKLPFQIIYKRIPIVDHTQPSQDELLKFISFLKNDCNFDYDVIHLHCHGGKGRTTSMGLIIDMFVKMQNSLLQNYSFNELIKLQFELGGSNLGSHTQEFSQERYLFLENLYNKLLQIENYSLQNHTAIALEMLFLRDDHVDINLEEYFTQYELSNDNILSLTSLYYDIIV